MITTEPRTNSEESRETNRSIGVLCMIMGFVVLLSSAICFFHTHPVLFLSVFSFFGMVFTAFASIVFPAAIFLTSVMFFIKVFLR